MNKTAMSHGNKILRLDLLPFLGHPVFHIPWYGQCFLIAIEVIQKFPQLKRCKIYPSYCQIYCTGYRNSFKFSELNRFVYYMATDTAFLQSDQGSPAGGVQ